MIATGAAFTLSGTPPNWSQGAWHGHWAKVWREKAVWLEDAILFGREARRRARWEICPKERRVVEIRCYRVHLMDHDGATISIKPILDGLKVSLRKRDRSIRKMLIVPGAGLIYDDRPEYVELISPGNLQVRVAHLADQRTEVAVRLI